MLLGMISRLKIRQAMASPSMSLSGTVLNKLGAAQLWGHYIHPSPSVSSVVLA